MNNWLFMGSHSGFNDKSLKKIINVPSFATTRITASKKKDYNIYLAAFSTCIIFLTKISVCLEFCFCHTCFSKVRYRRPVYRP